MRLRHISSFHSALIVTLAGGSTALAVPPGAKDYRAGDGLTGDAARPELRRRAPAEGATPGADLSGAWRAIGRGASGVDGAIATLDSGFESLQILPAELVGQRDTVAWGGSAASVTGRNVFAAATAPLALPRYGVVSDPVAGNATKKLRGFVAPPAFGPNTFFGRWCRYDFAKTNIPAGGVNTRFVLRPDTDQNLRVVHDTYINSLTSLWTSEPTYVSSGFVVARTLWGGAQEIGIPTVVGPSPDFFTLAPNPEAFLTGIFVPCRYPAGHPFAGQTVTPPVGSWFRLIHEFDTGGASIIKVDFLDGQGEIEIYRNLAIQVGRMDRMAFACGMEVANDACYIDNLHAEGVEFVLPVAPDLLCTGGQYADNERWLFPGPITGQSTRWVDAFSSHAVVIPDGVDQAIRRTNFFNDDRYRQELRTLLPLTFASAQGPFSVCIQVTISDSVAAPNQTVQAITPASITDNEFVTRLFIGRHDPAANPQYLSRVYVQINPDYNPIDDENTLTPYQPGPNGNGGVPLIGTDIADTGVNWVFNSQRNVCFFVNQNRALAINVNGTTVYTGTSFVNSIDQLHLESENNHPGVGNTIVYDDLVLTCATLPCACGLPFFTLVYNDDLEWGLTNVTIGLQDDDHNPATPFRWTSASDMPIVSLQFDAVSKVLKMENLFRDQPPAAPNAPGEFPSFEQASTQIPHVTASATRGWVVKCDNLLTDAATTRTWAVGQGPIEAPQFARDTAITFSSVTGTFWVQQPAPTVQDPFASTWEDTRTTLAGAGAALNQFFGLSIARNLSGEFTFRIYGKLLRYTGGPNSGQAVKTTSLSSAANGTHKDLDRLLFFSSDEETAPIGSILYIDNIRAWSLPCLGDTNNDGVVNFNDLNNVLAFFTAVGPDVTGNVGPDADNDGVPDDNIVNFTDLNLVLSGFGRPCN